MLTRLLKSFIPRNFLIHYYALEAWFNGEPELHLLRRLCDRNKISIDVGANIGIYSYYIRRYSKHCYAFEPNPAFVNILKETYKKSITVFPYALSDCNHDAVILKIPVVNGIRSDGLATLEGSYFTDYATLMVKTKRLDDFNFRQIGFIKIDIEGHELAFLRGAKKTLEREHPNILIEAEERYKSGTVNDVCKFLSAMGYQGFFFLNKVLQPVQSFDLLEHQKNPLREREQGSKNAKYVINFIYTYKT